MKLYADLIRDIFRRQPPRWSQLFPLLFLPQKMETSIFTWSWLLHCPTRVKVHSICHEDRTSGLSPQNLFSTSAIFLLFSPFFLGPPLYSSRLWSSLKSTPPDAPLSSLSPILNSTLSFLLLLMPQNSSLLPFPPLPLLLYRWFLKSRLLLKSFLISKHWENQDKRPTDPSSSAQFSCKK